MPESPLTPRSQLPEGDRSGEGEKVQPEAGECSLVDIMTEFACGLRHSSGLWTGYYRDMISKQVVGQLLEDIADGIERAIAESKGESGE